MSQPKLITFFSVLLWALYWCASGVNASDSTAALKGINAPKYYPYNKAVNFGGIYSSGACVPAPVCPQGTTPSIVTSALGVMAVTSVAGCTGTKGTSCTTVVTNPVFSYRTFATGTSTGAPVASPTYPNTCSNPTATSGGTACSGVSSSDPSGTQYWRVCLFVTTTTGQITPSGTYASQWGQLLGSIQALTRCMPTSGDVPTGSSITTYSQ